MQLVEIISYSNKIEELWYLLGFDCCFTLDREGRRGGVVVYGRIPCTVLFKVICVITLIL